MKRRASMSGTHAILASSFIPSISRDARKRGSRRRTRRVWNVEALEGRALLSVYVVTSPSDAGNGTGLVGDLRYAIDQADQEQGASTIVFNPVVFNHPITLTNGTLTIDKPS